MYTAFEEGTEYTGPLSVELPNGYWLSVPKGWKLISMNPPVLKPEEPEE